MSWLRQALSDERGLGDIAYGGIGAIIVMFIVVTAYLCVMVAIGYFRGVPFDPFPIAQAFSLVVGAVFTTGLTGLTAYMLATKPKTTVALPMPPAAP